MEDVNKKLSALPSAYDIEAQLTLANQELKARIAILESQPVESGKHECVARLQMTCTDQVLFYSNIGASALLLLGTLLRFALISYGFFFTICTIYMLIFDILLIVGLLVNQGHLLENEYVRKVTVMFFAVTTVFG